jgi:hypothetical protein
MNDMQRFSIHALLTVVLGVAAFVATGCAEVSKEDTSTSGPKSTVERTENEDGSVTGAFAKDATSDQTLVGAGEHSETSILVAPGALSIDTNVTMADGAALEGNLLPEELGLENVAILGGTTPLSVEADKSEAIDGSFTLALPIPLDQVQDAEGAGLSLLAGKAKVGILYMVKTSDGNKIGLFIPGVDDLIGLVIHFKGAKFGWFRFVVLSSATETVEKSTDRKVLGPAE